MPKAIDLFAGPGGLSLGLGAAGFEVVSAVESNSAAGETYRHNIGAHTEIRDITEFDAKRLRGKLESDEVLARGDNISLVAGGPPCPGFSLIGRSKIMDLIRKGEGDYAGRKEFEHRFIDDPRNRLFREFVKYVQVFQPDYFLMENVTGMRSYNLDGDPVIQVIKDSFGDDYNVEDFVLRASDYGVPQNRQRIIFLGSRAGMPRCEAPEPTHPDNKITAFDAIRDLWNVKPTDDGIVRVRDDDRDTAGRRFRTEMRNWECYREDGNSVASRTGRKTCHWTRKVNDRDSVLFPFIRSGAPSFQKGSVTIPDSRPRQIYGDIYPDMWESHIVPAFKKAGLSAWKRYGRHHVRNKNGKRWVMYPSEIFKDKMRRIRWDKPAPTIVAHLAKDGYMFIHPSEHRTITVREAARFQSFPDAFEFRGPMSAQFHQVGNAVPPVMAKAIGQAIIKNL